MTMQTAASYRALATFLRGLARNGIAPRANRKEAARLEMIARAIEAGK